MSGALRSLFYVRSTPVTQNKSDRSTPVTQRKQWNLINESDLWLLSKFFTFLDICIFPGLAVVAPLPQHPHHVGQHVLRIFAGPFFRKRDQPVESDEIAKVWGVFLPRT